MYTVTTSILYGKEVRAITRQNPDGSVTSFGEYPDNTDYAEYLRWIEAGNTPLPADTPES